MSGSVLRCPEDTVRYQFSTFDSYSLCTPFLWWFLNLGRKDCGRGVSCMVSHTSNTSSLFLTFVHCTKTLLWWGHKVALLFWLSDADLEGNLTLCPFRGIIIDMEPVSSLLMGALLDFQYEARFLLWNRSSVQSDCGWLSPQCLSH